MVAKLWVKKTKALGIPHTPSYSFCDFMASAAQVNKWQKDDLPTDSFSTENGVFVTKGLRWALNIDPQT
jgi:dynein heavy chain